jgi:serine/threonine-protein kinase
MGVRRPPAHPADSTDDEDAPVESSIQVAPLGAFSDAPASPSTTVRNRSEPPPPRGDLEAATEGAPGDRFGRYQLLGRIAKGGMAEIFLARETARGVSRHVVIKRVIQRVAADPTFIRMFLDEARLVMRLNHPNVCHIYEFGQLDGSYFIAMEHVHGMSLAQLVRRARVWGGVPIEVAVKIIAEVAGALHYAHEARDEDGQLLSIVHRDVSPQNVMIRFDGAVKLLDFGVAKTESGTVQTEAGVLKGKLAYMSPEQCRGIRVDRRSDLFSLGCCLYEALSAQTLFKRESEYSTIRAVVEEEAPPISDVRAEIPESLGRIVMRSLAKDPSQRYQTAAAMQEAMMEWLLDSGHFVTDAKKATLMEELFAEELARGPQLERVKAPSDAPTVAASASSPSSRSARPSSKPRARGEWAILEGVGQGPEPATSAEPPTPAAMSAEPAAAPVPSAEPPTPAVPSAEPPTPAVTSAEPPDLEPTANKEATVEEAGAPKRAEDTPPVVDIEVEEPVAAVTAAATAGAPAPAAAAAPPPRRRWRLAAVLVALAVALVVGLAFAVGSGPDDDVEVETVRSSESIGGEDPTGESEAGATSGVDEGVADPGGEIDEGVADPGGRAEEGEAPGEEAADDEGPDDTRVRRGFLTINTRPWTTVFVNGRRIGPTPIGRLRVRAGALRLRLVDEAGTTHRRGVRVRPGQHRTVFYELD